MNWLANYMAAREHLDIAEVGHEINSARKGEAAAPIRAKPRTRKPADKNPAAQKATPTKRAARPAGAKA